MFSYSDCKHADCSRPTQHGFQKWLSGVRTDKCTGQAGRNVPGQGSRKVSDIGMPSARSVKWHTNKFLTSPLSEDYFLRSAEAVEWCKLHQCCTVLHRATLMENLRSMTNGIKVARVGQH